MKWGDSPEERELCELAAEIARERQVSHTTALKVARRQLAGLRTVAARWDLASLLRRPRKPPTA